MYLDDILVASDTYEKHYNDVKRVMIIYMATAQTLTSPSPVSDSEESIISNKLFTPKG